MPEAETIEQRVRLVTGEVLDRKPDELRPGDLLAADLGMDSLSATELALVLEDEFDIRVAQAEREEIRCFGDVVRVVTEKLAAAPP